MKDFAKMIAEQWREEFLRFVETGKASKGFLEYLDEDEQCQEAVDLAFKRQAKRFGQVESRPETGPMQFGDDWPGVFLRGDQAFAYAIALKKVLDALPSAEKVLPSFLSLKGLIDTLRSCREQDRPDDVLVQTAVLTGTRMREYLYETVNELVEAVNEAKAQGHSLVAYDFPKSFTVGFHDTDANIHHGIDFKRIVENPPGCPRLFHTPEGRQLYAKKPLKEPNHASVRYSLAWRPDNLYEPIWFYDDEGNKTGTIVIQWPLLKMGTPDIEAVLAGDYKVLRWDFKPLRPDDPESPNERVELERVLWNWPPGSSDYLCKFYPSGTVDIIPTRQSLLRLLREKLPPYHTTYEAIMEEVQELLP